MKIFFLLLVVFLSLNLYISADNNSVNQAQTVPWVREQYLQFNMGILAKIYKDGVLFQPSGVYLGVFKDNKCWGLATLGNSPVGPLINLTMGYNTATATDFNYQVYDPNTSKYYNVTEMVNFTNGVPVGAINAPISLNISSEVVTDIKTVEIDKINVFPTQVETEFQLVLNSNSSEHANIVVCNLQGSLVKSIFNGTVNGVREMTVLREPTIAKGVYLIEAKIGENIIIKKLIFK